MRSFVALPIPETSLAGLVHVQSRLPFGRPVPEDNLHLTLAFLGGADGAALEALHDGLSTLIQPGPQITFAGLGTFADIDRGLVFVDVVANEALVALQEKVARQARMAGIDLPRRRFRPHVTLARANRQPKGHTRDQLAMMMGQSCDIPGFRATQMGLYRSDLTPDGARYTCLADYPLSG